jgi:hypothetical protein
LRERTVRFEQFLRGEAVMKKAGMALAVCTILAASALAQEMPKPGPELKKTGCPHGSWTLDGEMKPGAMGPAER